MKWEYQSIDQFVQAQDYVDTALVPLILIDTGEGIVDSTRQAGYVLTVAAAVEDQLRGRTMLFPPFSFVADYEDTQLVHALNAYTTSLKNTNLKNVVFLTQSSWLQERQLEGVVGDVVEMGRTDMEAVAEMRTAAQQESQQLIKRFIQIWNR